MAGQDLVTANSSAIGAESREHLEEYVTFNIAGQMFGIPVLIVQDILLPENIAAIPLAPPEVRGSINLRGRIVTVIDVRVRLGLERRAINENDSLLSTPTDSDAEEDDNDAEEAAPKEEGEAGEGEEGGEGEDDQTEEEMADATAAVEEMKRKKQNHMMAVTVEHHNELYTLLVDSVGDVIGLSKDGYEGNPSTLDPLWREFASGIYRLEDSLMVVLDVERLLDFKAEV